MVSFCIYPTILLLLLSFEASTFLAREHSLEHLFLLSFVYFIPLFTIKFKSSLRYLRNKVTHLKLKCRLTRITSFIVMENEAHYNPESIFSMLHIILY